MEILYVKLKPTKKGYVTDFRKLFDEFLSSGKAYVRWANYPQKNAYVCQISSINFCKRNRPIKVKLHKRKEHVYIVREDQIDVFLHEIGL